MSTLKQEKIWSKLIKQTKSHILNDFMFLNGSLKKIAFSDHILEKTENTFCLFVSSLMESYHHL